MPFSQAPGAVVEALAFMKNRISQALGINPDFNEVLRYLILPSHLLLFPDFRCQCGLHGEAKDGGT